MFMSKITFNNSNSAFFQSVKSSVDSYFKTQKLKRTGNWKLYLKAWILIPAAIGVYLFLLLAIIRLFGYSCAIFLRVDTGMYRV